MHMKCRLEFWNNLAALIREKFLSCSSRNKSHLLQTFISLKIWGHLMFDSITRHNFPEPLGIGFWKGDEEKYRKCSFNMRCFVHLYLWQYSGDAFSKKSKQSVMLYTGQRKLFLKCYQITTWNNKTFSCFW